MYIPYDQDPVQYFHIAVRTSVAGQAAVIKSTLQRLDPTLTFPEARTMDEIIGEGSMRRRLQAALLAAAAGVALLLAAIGIYGVLSFSVEQRKQEIGVRMALGAQPQSILRMILVHGLKLALIGLLLGICGAMSLTRVMTSVLFEVSPWDPLIFTAVSFLMLIVAAVACLAPATRATRVDPLRTLRYE